MSLGLLTDDWRMKLLALGLAVLMLGAVAFSQNPPTTNHLTLIIGYTVPPSIILINPPTKTDITYTGLADVISHVNSSNLTASVDATRALPSAAVRLNIVARATDPRVTVQQPPPIVVQVDTRQVRELPVILFTPDLRGPRDIHQLRLDIQRLAALQDAPGEHRAHTELAPDFLRVNLLPFVTRDHAARHDAQIGNLRKAVDEAFGNTVGEILRVRVAALVREGQHGDGVDRLNRICRR